jgi:hypothetical protein
MSEVTRVLQQLEHGESQAAEALLPLVYEELRRLAASKLAREADSQRQVATQAQSRAEQSALEVSHRADSVRRGRGHRDGRRGGRRCLVVDP